MKPSIELIRILADGSWSGDYSFDPEMISEVCIRQAAYYREAGYVEPWTGYLVGCEGRLAGVGSFKGPPNGRKVEIAYFVFPEHEGNGLATETARKLTTLALEHDPFLRVTARTLPENSASTRVLEKAGFEMTETIEDPEDGPVWEWEYRGNSPA